MANKSVCSIVQDKPNKTYSVVVPCDDDPNMEHVVLDKIPTLAEAKLCLKAADAAYQIGRAQFAAMF